MPTPVSQDFAGIPTGQACESPADVIVAEGGCTASPSTAGGLVDPVYYNTGGHQQRTAGSQATMVNIPHLSSDRADYVAVLFTSS